MESPPDSPPSREPTTAAPCSCVGDHPLREDVRARLAGAALAFVADPVVITDRTGVIVFANAAFTRQNGYTEAEVVGKRPSLLRGETPPEVYEQLWKTILEGRSWQGLVKNRRKDGSCYEAELTIVPMPADVVSPRSAAHDGVDGYFVSTHRDVTEHRRLIAHMMTVDRLASVGTLAAGVSHEINNPLAYVVANLEVVARELGALQRELDDPARTAENEAPLAQRLRHLTAAIADAREGASRVQHIVADLRTYARPRECAPTNVDLAAVIELAAKMSAHELRPSVTLTRDCEHVPMVRADASRLGEVFVNLLVNAAQAMPRDRPEPSSIRIAARAEGADVVVVVRDNGTGIGPEHLPRIFEPFYTTKPAGQGSGLGLWICRNIIASLGGTIAVTSVVGVGTTFTIRLVASGGAKPPVLRSREPPIAVRRLRILVVDDEPAIGRALQRMLRRDHDVHVETNASKARERLTAGDDWDAVLCDLSMPEVSGPELHRAVAEAQPALARRFLIVTGGSTTDEAQTFLDVTNLPRIYKPFSREQVMETLKTLVEREGATARE